MLLNYRNSRATQATRICVVVLAAGLAAACWGPDEELQSLGVETRQCLRLVDETQFTGPEVGYTWILATTPSGERTYIRPVFARHEIGVFGEGARHLRTIGREGQGPGEFMAVKAISPRPDGSLFLLDPGNRRLSKVDSLGSVLRTVPVPVQAEDNGLIVLSDSTLIVAGRLPTNEHYGYSFFRLDNAGSVITAYSGPITVPGMGQRYEPVVVASGPGPGPRIWSTPRNRMALTEWTLEGDSVRSLVMARPWLEGPAPDPEEDGILEEHGGAEVLPPERRIIDLARASPSDTRLLLIGHTADPSWEQAGRPAETGQWSGRFDSVVELWDIERGSLVCSQRYDEFLVRLDQGFAFGYSEDRDGRPVIHRWRVQYQ